MVDQDIIDFLGMHLGQGEMTEASLENIAQLDALCPDACRGSGGRIFRAVLLDKEEAGRLSSGFSIEMSPRSHTSWSRSEAAVRPLLRTRLERSPDRAVALLMRDVEEVAIDIEMFARHLGLDQSSMGLWLTYAGREQEVILRNPPGPVFIHPHEVVRVYSWDNIQDLAYPIKGEVFIDHSSSLQEVEDFEGMDENGCAMVISGGRRHRLVHLGSGWEIGADPYMDLEM